MEAIHELLAERDRLQQQVRDLKDQRKYWRAQALIAKHVAAGGEPNTMHAGMDEMGEHLEATKGEKALSSRPVQGGETLAALLVRDVAEMAGVSVPDICTAVRAIGHGETSTNTAIHPMVAVCAVAYLRKEGQFVALSSAPAREPMTDEQAEAFRHEWLTNPVRESSPLVAGIRYAERHHGICKE